MTVVSMNDVCVAGAFGSEITYASTCEVAITHRPIRLRFPCPPAKRQSGARRGLGIIECG